jgi:transcriptional regulator with XRE-family HTH domain
MVFGQKLRAAREEQNLSLGDLATMSGVNKGYLWSLENERQKNPGILMASKIAEALGVDLNYLVSQADLAESLQGDAPVPDALQKFIELRKHHGRPLSPRDISDLMRIQFRGKRPTQASHYEVLMAQLEIFTRESEMELGQADAAGDVAVTTPAEGTGLSEAGDRLDGPGETGSAGGTRDSGQDR